MTTQRLGRVAGLAALALLLSRCGGDDNRADTAGDARRIDACDLVPKSEMETIVGATIKEADSDFSEHTYTKPTTYSARCTYTGEQMVMLMVHYPTLSGAPSSDALASQITQQLRSQVGNDPETDEIYRTTQVQPVQGLAAPAAAYDMVGQTTLEVHTGPYAMKIMAPSLDQATQMAEKAIGRLE